MASTPNTNLVAAAVSVETGVSEPIDTASSGGTHRYSRHRFWLSA